MSKWQKFLTFLSKIDEMKSEIKKTFYNPPAVWFPLFISDNKLFFSPNRKPLFKLAFWSFLTSAEISVMRPLWGSRWSLLSVSEKKIIFF